MDIWAYCASCRRWFYVGSDPGETSSSCRCPVCVSTPTAWSDRAQHAAPEAVAVAG